MAQPAHPQPQDDFPFFLLRTIPAITTATTIIRTALMMIVAIFSISHVSIIIPPSRAVRHCPLLLLSYFAIFSFTFVVSFVASLYGLNSIYTMPARMTMAASRPITFRFPVNAEPIWFTISATA